MHLSEDLILNCHARSTPQITAKFLFPSQSQMQKVMNLSGPQGWFPRFLAEAQNETIQRSNLNKNG